MALRNRKRVFADYRRAPDGSAFQKCNSCGASIAVALADMHVCEGKIKKAKPQFQKIEICKVDRVGQQPRSPFLFFRDTFARTSEGVDIVGIDKKACIVWKNMSLVEQRPYVYQSEMVDRAYAKTLRQENTGLKQEDDEADSRNVFQKRQLFDIDISTSSSADDDIDIRTSSSDHDNDIFN